MNRAEGVHFVTQHTSCLVLIRTKFKRYKMRECSRLATVAKSHLARVFGKISAKHLFNGSAEIVAMTGEPIRQQPERSVCNNIF